MTGPPRLRAAVDADAPGVIALVERCFADYPGCVLLVEEEEPDLLRPASSLAFDRFWVVEDAGGIAGSIACKTHGEWMHLQKLYVHPRLRGAGFGRRLIERVEDEARAAACIGIELWTDTRFVTAHAVYSHLGYQRTGALRELHDVSATVEYHFRKELGPHRL
jgi:putative acetyltransferase